MSGTRQWNRHWERQTYSWLKSPSNPWVFEPAACGAAVGSIIGAAGGGKGAVVGAGVGGGLGAGSEVITKGEQVKMPSETLLDFTLQQELSIPSHRVS